MTVAQARQRLTTLLDATWPAPRPLPPLGAPVAVYGAGNCGRDVLHALRGRGCRIVAVLDMRAAEICAVEGVTCLAPGSDAARVLAQQGVPVVLGVFSYAADTGAIVEALAQAGFAQVISYYELFESMPTDLASRFWLAPRARYREWRAEVLAGAELWADDVSRQVYADLLALRLTWDTRLLRAPDRDHPYCPPGLPVPASPVRLVDGGAFTGDSLEGLLAHGVALAAVAAFEPDPANFRKLRACVARRAAELGEAILFPCGLGEATGVGAFVSGRGGGSGLATHGDTLVSVVRLDDVLPTFAPTLIKLDIEGAEPAALRGAAESIIRHQPQLAVSVYHAPEHLWQVPRQMADLLPTHALALRYHQFNGFDTVAYAYRR